MASAIGNFFIKAILRSPLHALLGPSFAVITVKGRKTGKFYSTPINVAPQGGSYTVRGEWQGYRSSRLGAQYRVIYRVIAEQSLLQVVHITPHDYRRV